jgi:hypothetical protein
MDGGREERFGMVAVQDCVVGAGGVNKRTCLPACFPLPSCFHHEHGFFRLMFSAFASSWFRAPSVLYSN